MPTPDPTPPVAAGEPRMLVDGKLVEAEGGRRFPNVNPATEEVVGEVADAGPADMDRAVAAARRAFDETTWATDHAFRRRCLEQLQAGLDRAKEEVRAQVVTESGSPVMMTRAVQVDDTIRDVSWWARLADTYPYDEELGEKVVFGQPTRRLLAREPVGVVGAVTPWNIPLYLNLTKIAPALAAGNTVVLKPAPDTPWSATAIARVAAEETDIPPGVLNVVTTSDNTVAEALVADPRVDMITFTGSTATGRRIMATAAATVKKLFLELGGKSASIVLDDADVAQAAAGAARGACLHSGQGCTLYTRLLVPRSRYDEAVGAAEAAMGEVPYGDPWDPSVVQGPQISEAQRRRVLGYVETAVAEGARLVTGGQPPAHLPRGYFVEPTLFADVDPASTIAQEEVFGPVLVVIAYEDDDDAVRIANGTIYGLSGAVHSADPERALRLARRLRTGTVAAGGSWFGVDVPFGGYRQSGIGRENGVMGFEEYLEVKTIGLPGTAPA